MSAALDVVWEQGMKTRLGGGRGHAAMSSLISSDVRNPEEEINVENEALFTAGSR